MRKIGCILAALLLICYASAAAASAWVPKEAPAVRIGMDDSARLAAQTSILQQGTLLYSGKTDQGYYPSEISWLTAAAADDAIALLWACDDVTHAGWGVLGLGINDYQERINSVSDHPDRERLMLIHVGELLKKAAVASPAEIRRFSVGAWNGGRLSGVYFLKADAASEMKAHLAAVEQANALIHTYDSNLSNAHASPEARAVYAYLQQIYGKACLTGQMESTWMGSPDYEMNFIQKHTGRLPAIRGLDFTQSKFQSVTNRAIEWWQKGGIPMICWHTGIDFTSGYNESKAHNLNWEKAMTPGTAEYTNLLQAMDLAVPYLQMLEDAGVAVLWRPFHELDGGWFWWSKGGADSFVKLWQLMYSRYTDYWGLNNLIWLLAYSGNGAEMTAWYPGDQYVDLIGADRYDLETNGQLYAAVKEIAPEGMPVVFHECGTIPTEKQMKADHAPWALFMTWNTDYVTSGEYNTPSSLKEIYQSAYFITLDELPSFIGKH